MIAAVYIDSTSAAVDKVFDYEVPEDLINIIKPAMRVVVPFGKGNKPCQAFVVDTSEHSRPDIKLKMISRAVDSAPVIPLYLLKLAEYLREEYFCTYNEALRIILSNVTASSSVRKKDEYIAPKSGILLSEALEKTRSNAVRQRELLRIIYENGSMSRGELSQYAGAGADSLKKLQQLDLIEIYEPEKKQEPLREKIMLNEDQQSAVQEFLAHVNEPSAKYLLYGVTGSGKTEVYFKMFEHFVEKGRQCLLLVPEISLTPQMIELTAGRFRAETAVIHSRLTPSERHSAFLKVRSGEAKIILGARSALFMPFSDLALIVVDEEHESSYKSSQTPRYDAVAVANKICGLTGAQLVLSSATPSIESFYKAQNGAYRLLVLPKRAGGSELPKVSIADMRKEMYSGNRTPISNALNAAVSDRLNKGEQVLLFLNRRGHSTYVFCRSCGYTEMCTSCSVALTYHESSSTLICHYCGHKRKVPSVCPECGSEKIKYMGTGTEKIQKQVEAMFPKARVSRLDSDTASKKGVYEEVLGAFSRGESDILIGTQMIVKGLDFRNVTLVGILLADVSLNFPDINSASKTFQLTSQAAGRAGRRGVQGEVIIQTYQPQNQTLVYSSLHNYEGFYAYDIAHRKQFGYPPFTEVLGIFIAHEDESICISDAGKIFEEMKLTAAQSSAKIYNPAPAYIQKLKGKYIYHILALYDSDSSFKKDLRMRYNGLKKGSASSIFAEVNPVTLL